MKKDLTRSMGTTPQISWPRRAGSPLWCRVSAGPVPDPLQPCDKAEDELIFLWVNYLCDE